MDGAVQGGYDGIGEGRRAVKVAVRVRRARYGGRDWRVICPSGDTGHAVLWEQQVCTCGYELCVDRRAAYRIGVLWLLAARSRHSVVWLPLRGAERDPDESLAGPRLDLVLSHHSLQLRASSWPRLRGALDAGAPQTVSVPAGYLPDAADIDHTTWYHREQRDLIHHRVHADTLFLAGSAPVLRQTARSLFEVAFEAPGSAPGEEAAQHVCREMYWPDPRTGDSRGIHVAYRSHWPAPA
ncbi:hypothetical protein [Actinocatenispora rupis]|uniref:hypothetical protein n=1 Tax=Actinocatenispora rupis TaxID=519421 RepID=UPI001942A0FB|nr:hypothetical protein [Actinocatenispora rupis]